MERFRSRGLNLWLILPLLFTQVSCKDKDSEIKADLTSKAKESVAFAGVRYSVENGVVTLSGACSSTKMRDEVEKSAKGIYSVRDVVNTVAVAPVVIGTDRELMLRADSVLQDYPAAWALVRDSVIVLQGKAKPADITKLMTALQGLNPAGVRNELQPG